MGGGVQLIILKLWQNELLDLGVWGRMYAGQFARKAEKKPLGNIGLI